MPEPDFGGLRADIENAAKQPEFAAVEARAARARMRIVAGAATATAVTILAAAAFAASRIPTGDAPRPGGSPSSADVFPGHTTRQVLASSLDRVYLIRAECADGASDGPTECAATVRESADGGGSWAAARPIPQQPGWRLVSVMALGGRVLLATTIDALNPAPGVNQSPGAPAPDRSDTELLVSRDGGATWRPVTLRAAAVDRLATDRFVLPWSGDPCKVLSLDAATGDLAPLVNQPPIRCVGIEYTPARAGIWVTGWDPATRRPAVSVSHDRGASWTSHVFTDVPPVADEANRPGGSPPPDLPPASSAPAVATSDGTTLYALIQSAGRVATQTVHHSGDGGRTWRRRAARDLPEDAFGMVPFVTTDGALVFVLHPDGPVATSDEGASFHRTTLNGLSTYTYPVQATNDGFVTQDETKLYRSRDGRTWQARALPTN